MANHESVNIMSDSKSEAQRQERIERDDLEAWLRYVEHMTEPLSYEYERSLYRAIMWESNT
jgi:hypothetical protein